MGRPVKLTEEMKWYLSRLATDEDGNFKKIPAKKALSELMQRFPTASISQSLIHRELKDIKDLSQTPSEFDQLWSVGDCIKYDIPADIIPVLVEEMKRPRNINPTIRQARWLAKLYPALSKLLSQEFPDDPKRQRAGLWIVVKQYAHRERMNYTTSDLDNQYFIRGDFSDITLTAGIIDYCFSEKMKAEMRNEAKKIKQRTVKNERLNISAQTQGRRGQSRSIW